MVLLAPPSEWFSSPPQLPSGEVIVIFYASIDPKTGQMWCSDCRKVKSTIDWLFNGNDKPAAYIIWVGSKAEWKLPAANQFRTDYKVDSVPTMIKYKDGKEVARLVENEILDTNALGGFF